MHQYPHERRWAVLPARLRSVRLPEKVLAELDGRSMLEHVWRRVRQVDAFDRVLVATDDDRIAEAVRAFGGEVVRTGEARNGTHRVSLAVGAARVQVINVQADQPLLDPAHLEVLIRRLDAGADVATLCAPLVGDPHDRARVKVLRDGTDAVAFSRRVFPEAGPPQVHVGIYGFGPGWVTRCAEAPPTARSRQEDLEQVAWLEAGIHIAVDEVDRVSPSVDTPEDLEEVRKRIASP